MHDQPDNPFWDYSIALYREVDVASLCLELQDRFGFDVNVLLYACWLAHLRLPLRQGHLTEIEVNIARWREHVVHPLRKLRRQWRDVADITPLREGLKTLELEAERQQQDMMYAAFKAVPAAPAAGVSVRSNLAVVATVSDNPETAVASLLDKLAQHCERRNSG